MITGIKKENVMRIKYLWFIIPAILGLCLFTIDNYSKEKKKPQYIGVEKCAKLCHKSKKQGEQYSKWQESKHAKAFISLASPVAEEFLKEAGGEGKPQENEMCLACHSTGHGRDTTDFKETFKVEEGITCEGCHGPGSAYRSISIMKDQEKFLANGGIVPKKENCLKCHENKVHHVRQFRFDEWYEIIAHEIPEKEEKADKKEAEKK